MRPSSRELRGINLSTLDIGNTSKIGALGAASAIAFSCFAACRASPTGDESRVCRVSAEINYRPAEESRTARDWDRVTHELEAAARATDNPILHDSGLAAARQMRSIGPWDLPYPKRLARTWERFYDECSRVFPGR
jgi:hypothetical protein